MPTLPLRERVLESIANRLRGVVAGEKYFNTVARVSRVLMSAERAVEAVPTVFVLSGGEQTSDLDGATSGTGLQYTTMEVTVSAFWLEEQASDTSANKLAHDLQKAVCSDRFNSQTSINTTYLGMSITSNEAIQPYAHLSLRFQVRFRHEFANPSQKR